MKTHQKTRNEIIKTLKDYHKKYEVYNPKIDYNKIANSLLMIYELKHSKKINRFINQSKINSKKPLKVLTGHSKNNIIEPLGE